MSTPTTSPIQEVPANENGRGNLAGYRASCGCGLELTSTMLTSLQLDLEQHARWHASLQTIRREADASQRVAGWVQRSQAGLLQGKVLR